MGLSKKIIVISGMWVAVMGAAYANGASVSIPLTTCTENNAFYCLSVGGGAFKKPVDVRFDTGGNVFIIPMDCLKSGGYQVVPGQPPGIQDPWGNPSVIVQADISLMNGNQEAVTLRGFQFMAGTQGTCETGFSNFGAGFDFYTNFPWSKQSSPQLKKESKPKTLSRYSKPIITPPNISKVSQRNYGSAPNGGWDHCLASFFTFYTSQNGVANQAYGFETNYINSVLHLTIGPITTNGGQTFQFASQSARQCGGQDNMIEYLGATGTTWTGPSVGDFLINIDGIAVGPTQLKSKSIQQDGTKIMMVDSGGGMLIIADDKEASIAQKFVPSGHASPCPQASINWLTGCFCFNGGLKVNVSSATNPAISYSYTTTDVLAGQSQAAAICPPWGQQPLNPYIAPNSFNSGGELFRQMGVAFDFKNGQLILKPHTQKTSIKRE
jgi:hypothetical protein